MSQTEIKTYLSGYPNGLTVKQLIVLTGLSDGTLRDQLNALEKWREIIVDCSVRPYVYKLSKFMEEL